MNRQPDPAFERWLRQRAAQFVYPPTPQITAALGRKLSASSRRASPRRRQRLAWATGGLVLLLASLLAVPQVRAAVQEFFQLGAIRILREPATPAAGALIPIAGEHPDLISLLDLPGETTLAEARSEVPYALPLPTYPDGLGPPDRVFVQDLNGPVAILVWLDPADATRTQLSLHLYGPGTLAEKQPVEVIFETQVNGLPALWTSGPYLLSFRQPDGSQYGLARLVSGNVLIWQQGGVTYRLEGGMSMEQAIRIAESLE